MEVDEKGDGKLRPGKLVKGMGGAMDLVAGVGRVIVAWITQTNMVIPNCAKGMHPAAD
jgi:acyl CoA:acetate/3-ketoacid CoA transferase beta subunit